MAFTLSTGLKKALQARMPAYGVTLKADTISFAADAISDSANGFGSFVDDEWVLIDSGSNKNVFAQIIAASAASLTFAAGTFTVESAGAIFSVSAIDTGSVQGCFKNMTPHIFSGTKPVDADQTEGAGTKLAEITKNGDAFVSGVATNGCNFQEFTGTTMNKAIDPATGIAEVWQGDGLASDTATWTRWYANTVVTGLSTSALRMDGTVSTVTGADLQLEGSADIVTGVPVVVTEVNVTISGT